MLDLRESCGRFMACELVEGLPLGCPMGLRSQTELSTYIFPLRARSLMVLCMRLREDCIAGSEDIFWPAYLWRLNPLGRLMGSQDQTGLSP